MEIRDICKEIEKRLETVHIGCFRGMEKPLLLISNEYPGVWLEHVYDAVFYAMRDRTKLYLAENTIDLFLSYQRADGQLPAYVWDGNKRDLPSEQLVGYGQIQECVSFASLALGVYRMNGKHAFLEKIYKGCAAWEEWLRTHRMTTGRGLIEMFVGYDTGHDNSGRLSGLAYPQGYVRAGESLPANAAVIPPCDTAPVLAVDMSCNYFGTLTALAQMADTLGKQDAASRYRKMAAAVKERLFALCFDEEDCFFYDVDKHGKKRRFLSSTIFHLFLEGVLDASTDAALIRALYNRHIANPKEFATPYPFPSMALSDPSCIDHKDYNCWGYYTQALIALRATIWMDGYGMSEDLDHLCRAHVQAWTAHYDEVKLGQELDPVTGIPTRCSQWYSSCMLFYLYAAERIGASGK